MALQAAADGENLARAQEDIPRCIDTLRSAQWHAEQELDSTVIWLMELGDIYICRERQLIAAATTDPTGDLHALGGCMIRQRERIAGAVQDLDGRS
jgi:hypothetical protein